jgi:hypothetical protein
VRDAKSHKTGLGINPLLQLLRVLCNWHTKGLPLARFEVCLVVSFSFGKVFLNFHASSSPCSAAFTSSHYQKRGPVGVEFLVQKKAAGLVQQCLIDLDNNRYITPISLDSSVSYIGRADWPSDPNSNRGSIFFDGKHLSFLAVSDSHLSLIGRSSRVAGYKGNVLESVMARACVENEFYVLGEALYDLALIEAEIGVENAGQQ